jgi:amino acid adenylation domain-containing protein
MTPEAKESLHLDVEMRSSYPSASGEEVLRPAFIVAGIAAYLSRAEDKSRIGLVYDRRLIELTVELSAPFTDLLAQAEKALVEASGLDFKEPGENPDAHILFDSEETHPDSGHENVPVFRIRLESDGWDLVLGNAASTRLDAKRTHQYLKTMLADAMRNPGRLTGTLRLIDEKNAAEIYGALNQTKSALPPHATVVDLFAESAAKYSNSDAIAFEDRTLSYADAGRVSTALAGILRARGADQERPVAICLPRSEMVPAILLAVLKAGSYFVPLDPTHPRQRLLDIVEECAPAVVLVSDQTREIFTGSDLPLLDPLHVAANESAATSQLPVAGDKAYMIYTSGTTGRPKGVVIRHNSLLNFLLAMRDKPGLNHGDRLLAVATLSFDISVMDMFLPLACGATLVVASEQATRDPWQLSRLLDGQKITCMQATPVTWRMLLSSGYQGHGSLKMISGGEALSRDLADQLLEIGSELWNCYGPTETTIYSSVVRVRPGNEPVTIGPPLANTVFYVADAAGQLLPPEFTGELYIGGLGVASGYYQRPELQRERFIPDRWTNDSNTSQTLFRTGDLVRLAANGRNEFEFFGRIDHQIKLRGYRIELGEIESVLRAHPAIKDAAVVLREDEPGEPWLVGYVTGSGSGASAQELRTLAAKRLPHYMIPSRIVRLQHLPLTGSGKVDRRALAALPAPTEAAAKVSSDTELDATEAALLRIFREVLRVPTFGPDDNFFEYGGYSLMAMRLFAKIGSTLRKQLPITALFDAPTVRSLATLIRRDGPLQPLVPIREGGSEPPFFLLHSYLLYGLIGNVVDRDRPVYGLREQASANTQLDLQQSVQEYLAAIERVSPTGLVHLGGWCAAGSLTVELAREVLARGRQVGMVALFDAEAPGFVPYTPGRRSIFVRLGAMWKFHRERTRLMNWTERLHYFWDRLAQAPLNTIEQFYARHHALVLRWQKRLPWLPGILFYNRFMQAGLLQADRLDAMDIRIQLFRARDVPMIPGSDPALGWGTVGRRGVDVKFIPGHHESMFLEPNVNVLREDFQELMRSVEDNDGDEQVRDRRADSLRLSRADDRL